MKIRLLLSIIFSFFFILLSSQVNVRLLTEYNTGNAIFSVNSGKYQVSNYTEKSISLSEGELALIVRYNDKIFIKKRNGDTLFGDSLEIKGETGVDFFSLRVNSPESVRRNYSGNLKCFSDMETLLLINNCDIENYIAGVVRAEGGNGRNEEYFKTQAIIARTYTYKYFNKHLIDKYNLCDDTHCQAFNGIIEDSIIISAVRNTSGLVITTPDSLLIISAFHSNCGGETSPSEFVWVTQQNYLGSVKDPYCSGSRNATWEQKISLKSWTDFITKNGYSGIISDPQVFNYNQTSRVADYNTGTFSMPLRTIRTGLGLKSSFFSVAADGDSLLLKGRGYGHGVGLCQEGAMVMAKEGFDFTKIINFYYSGVKIMRIEDVKKNESDKLSFANR